MPWTARQRELTARHLLAHPEEIAAHLKRREWDAVAAVVEFAARDAPASLMHTDPALYRLLRQQITEFRLRGWSCLDLEALQRLAREGASASEPSRPRAARPAKSARNRGASAG